MELSEAVALKLIAEIKKPGRECLYDLSNSCYKNNHKKQNVWSEVADAVGISRNDCQRHWKSLRRRLKAAVNKSNERNGSKRLKIKGFSKLLLTEMEYFINFTEDRESSVTDYSSPVLKKCFHPKKLVNIDEAEEDYEESIKTLNNLRPPVLQSSISKRDPFFLALEDEFAKVPENKKSILKVKLMSLVVENQQQFL